MNCHSSSSAHLIFAMEGPYPYSKIEDNHWSKQFMINFFFFKIFFSLFLCFFLSYLYLSLPNVPFSSYWLALALSPLHYCLLSLATGIALAFCGIKTSADSWSTISTHHDLEVRQVSGLLWSRRLCRLLRSRGSVDSRSACSASLSLLAFSLSLSLFALDPLRVSFCFISLEIEFLFINN